MIIKEERNKRVRTSVQIVKVQTGRRVVQPEKNPAQAHDSADVDGSLFSLVRNAPATFAERFPHLMVGVVAVAVLFAALTAEIECPRGAGYYWR